MWPGAQAPRRAEVIATLSAGGAALRLVVADCEYVAAGLRAVAQGAAGAHRDGPDGDLWAQFVGSLAPAVSAARAEQRMVALALLSARKSVVARLRWAHISIADVEVSVQPAQASVPPPPSPPTVLPEAMAMKPMRTRSGGRCSAASRPTGVPSRGSRDIAFFPATPRAANHQG